MRDVRTALLLAGGSEARWGWELQGESLVQRARRLLEGFFDEVRVVASDTAPFASAAPVFPLDDPGPLCDFLEERFLSGA